MLKKTLTLFLMIVMVSACSNSRDYSGVYIATQGDECEILQGENDILSIAQTKAGDKSYIATLNGDFSEAQGFPAESSPAQVSDDGTLTFSFIKEGGMFLQPRIEMNIHLMEKDAEHLYIESWKVKAESPLAGALGGTFDLVKDEKLSMMGMQASNQMHQIAGSKGLCIQKKSV